VVGVLLHRVVHRRLEVRLRPVVVDAEAAADVEVLERRAHLVQLDEEAPRLAHRVLERSNRRDLRAEVEVQELERSEQVVLLQKVDGLDHLARREAELRAIAARRLPAPRAARRQLGAHADARPHAHALGDVGDELELGGLLDDEDDGAPELRRQQRRLDVLLVLVAVADDERVFVVEHGHDGEQLRLRPGLEAVVILLAGLRDLLDDVAVLIDLDRVHALVRALVAVLGHGATERFVELDDAVLEDVVEADEQRQVDAAAPHFVDELLHVDRRRRRSVGRDADVARVVDRKVTAAPRAHRIHLGRVGHSPAARNPKSRCHFCLRASVQIRSRTIYSLARRDQYKMYGKMNRRRFLKASGYVLGAGALGFGAGLVAVQPRRSALPLPDGNDGRPEAPSTKKRVVVIGGGLAGLSAATELAARHFDVTLVERAAQLGGKLTAWPVRALGEEFPVEHGFHGFFAQYYNLRALLDAAGVSGDLAPSPGYPVLFADRPPETFGKTTRFF